MVLKRQRDGEYVTWTPAASAQASSSDSVPQPLAKKPRIKQADQHVSPKPSAATQLSQGSTSGALHSATPHVQNPPLKGSRKKTESDASRPEKRGAVFKKKCPQNILDRVERVMSQRFYMMDRQRTPGELKETFHVWGSTGNIYTVIIDHKPRCDCPDATRGNHCKHILFIFLKVLQVSQSSGVWYQKALLTSELETIFDEAPLAPNVLHKPQAQEAYARATGKLPSAQASSASSTNKRIPGTDDDCPICYDGMHGINEDSLVFCEECGNAIHKECFQQWQASSVKSGKSLTCVWCRARWATVGAEPGGSGVRRTSHGYLNLAGVSGTSPVRDTSSYYYGPRRGQRYFGHQEYDYDDD